ncbi:hypothetical protein Tco_0463664, partial [Tanacetum coccineum]
MSSSDGARGILGKSTLTPTCCPPTISALTLQHLPFSPATNPGYPGQLVAGDRFPGRLVARD